MRTFLGISKPSQALEAMVEGLLAMKDDPKFQIDMETYGDSERNEVCYGCAATCALQQLARVRFSAATIKSRACRAAAAGASELEVNLFERAIEWARGGYMRPLFRFFGMGDETARMYTAFFSLCNHTWEESIPEVQKVIKRMKAAGY